MLPFIIGAILIVIGILLSIIVPIKMKNKNIEIQYMQTTSLAEVKGILKDNLAAGLDGYRHYVEVKGNADSDNPEKAPFSERETAYYDADLFQVYEESVTHTDSNGHRHQSMQRRESLVSNQKSSGNIALKDPQTGDKIYIDVSQPGTQLEPLKTLDKFEPSNKMADYGFFQNLSFSGLGARTLGYRMVEKTIPLNQMLYVLGEAWLEGDRILMSKPGDKEKPFIVSTRSEEAIVQGNKTGANVALVIGIILAVAGILVMIFVR